MTDWSEAHKALDKFGNNVVRDAKKNLIRVKANASNQLLNSIQHDVIQHENSLELTFSMEQYAKFVDEGVRGHGQGAWKPWKRKGMRGRGSPFSYKYQPHHSQPPSDEFMKWIKLKGIQPRNAETGQFMSLKTSAFLMARSAGRYGLRRTQFFTKAVQKNVDTLNRDLRLPFIKDTTKYVQKEIFKIL